MGRVSAVGEVSQVELDAHTGLADTAHGGLASQAELDAHTGLADTAHGGLASQAELDAHTAAASTAGPHNAARIGARVTKAAAQSIPDNATAQIVFDTERWDDGGWHDNVTNNTRLTVPAGEPTRRYVIGADISFGLDVTNFRVVYIFLNGVTRIASMQTASAGSTAATRICLETVYQLVPGDFVEVQVLHTAGVAINVEAIPNHSPEFWIEAL